MLTRIGASNGCEGGRPINAALHAENSVRDRSGETQYRGQSGRWLTGGDSQAFSAMKTAVIAQTT